MDYINRELTDCIPKACPASLYEASRHLTKTGGKRIRPALLALSFAATEQNGREIDSTRVGSLGVVGVRVIFVRPHLARGFR